MTAKEYLQQAYKIDRRININIKKAQQMEQSLYGKAINYESDGSKNLTRGNTTEASILTVIEYKENIDILNKKLIDLRKKIEISISKINNDNEREVLERRYLLYQKWEQIASEMNYGVRHIHKLHGYALKKMALNGTIDL